MGDKTCTRYGYDDTGRYHVPVNDQCPDCRTPPGHDHAKGCTHTEALGGLCGSDEMKQAVNEYVEPETGCYCADVSSDGKFPATGNIIDIDQLVAIPLDIQEHIFRQGVDFASLDLERMLLQDWEEIKAMALDRLRGGFREFGCEMFTWDAATRRQNVLEEIADSLVYLISGPTDV